MKYMILLVDDNDDIVEYLERFLKDDYNILKARNGREALELLSHNEVHLIISDVMMPVLDGFELCKLVKTDMEICHIPVLLLTAKSTLESKIEGLETGADVYLEKPFSPEHLQVQIANLLRNRNRIKEHFVKSPLAHMFSMAYTKADQQLLEKVQQVIHDHIQDNQLDVEHLARFLNLSRPTLYRKLKDITDLTPNELINVIRLKRAAQLIAEGRSNMNEIAEAVGYTNANHFGRNFQKQFGMTPSEFAKELPHLPLDRTDLLRKY